MRSPPWLRRGRTVYFSRGKWADIGVISGPMVDSRRVWVRWSSGVESKAEISSLSATPPPPDKPEPPSERYWKCVDAKGIRPDLPRKQPLPGVDGQ